MVLLTMMRSAQLLALFSALFLIRAPSISIAATLRYLHFSITVSGGSRPIFTVTTDLPDGTEAMILLHTPWAPNAQARLKAGLSACDPDCMPPNVSPDPRALVKNGRFTIGPFTYVGQPLPPGTYQLEIDLMDDAMKTQPGEQWPAAYVSQLTVP